MSLPIVEAAQARIKESRLSDDNKKLLSCILKYVPSLKHQEKLAEEVHQSSSNKLGCIVEKYRHLLLLPMRASILEVHQYDIRSHADYSEEAVHLKRMALERDGFRCKLSGNFDSDSIETRRVQMPVTKEPGVWATEAARIIPLFILEMPDRDLCLELIRDFGGLKELNQQTLRSLKNVMTLDLTMQIGFKQMFTYLEKDRNDFDTYTQHVNAEHVLELILKHGSKVTFRASQHTVPDPKIFDIHAACTKIIYESGQAEWFKEIAENPKKMREELGLPTR